MGHLTQGGAGDPLLDTPLQIGSVGSRGALGRAKLQSGLVQKKGVDEAKVLQGRMDPTQKRPGPAVAPSSMTKYMERFGGYGQLKSIALIQWQVCVVLDLAMSEQMGGCLDVLSLLCVCLEQCALDNGSMGVGYLLSLQEEPPASIMSNRSLMSVGGRN